MDDYESLKHTKWECKYHVVFRVHDRSCWGDFADREGRGDDGSARPGRVPSPRNSAIDGVRVSL